MPKELRRSKVNYKIILFLSGLALVFFAFVFWLLGFNELSVRSNIRWSARFSVVCFCLAFSASSLYYFSPNKINTWILNNRNNLGITFAIIHIIHLLFLVTLHVFFHQVFIVRSLIEISLGGLAYLFILLMLLTSFETFASKLPIRKWKLLHTIGGYWILIVFTNSMLGRVIGGKIEYLPFALLLVSVWLLRITYWIKGRKN